MECELKDFGYRKDNWKKRFIGFLGEIHCWRLKYRRRLTEWMRGSLSILDSHFQTLSLNSAKSLEGRQLSQDQRLCLQGWLRVESRNNRVGNPNTEGFTDPAKKLECSKGVWLQIFLSFLRESYVTKVLLEPWGRGQIEQSPLHPPKVLAFLVLPFFYYLSFIKFKSRFSELLLMRGLDGCIHGWIDGWVGEWIDCSLLSCLHPCFSQSATLPFHLEFSSSSPLAWLGSEYYYNAVFICVHSFTIISLHVSLTNLRAFEGCDCTFSAS